VPNYWKGENGNVYYDLSDPKARAELAKMMPSGTKIPDSGVAEVNPETLKVNLDGSACGGQCDGLLGSVDRNKFNAATNGIKTEPLPGGPDMSGARSPSAYTGGLQLTARNNSEFGPIYTLNGSKNDIVNKLGLTPEQAAKIPDNITHAEVGS